MKKALALVLSLFSLSCLGDDFIAENITAVTAYKFGGDLTQIYMIWDSPGQSNNVQLIGAQMIVPDLKATRNVTVHGNLTCLGTVSAANTILWQTNIVAVTNAFVATNTPDGNPIAWTAGTNVWTGVNTYTGTVNLNGPVTVQGQGGGTSNVPMGGVTLVFINGFYIKSTVP